MDTDDTPLRAISGIDRLIHEPARLSVVLVLSIVESAELRTWAGDLIPFADSIVRNPRIKEGTEGVTLSIPASFIEERRRHHWQESGFGTSVVEIDRMVDREVEAIAAVYGLAAHAMAPMAVERVVIP